MHMYSSNTVILIGVSALLKKIGLVLDLVREGNVLYFEICLWINIDFYLTISLLYVRLKLNRHYLTNAVIDRDTCPFLARSDVSSCHNICLMVSMFCIILLEVIKVLFKRNPFCLSYPKHSLLKNNVLNAHYDCV